MLIVKYGPRLIPAPASAASLPAPRRPPAHRRAPLARHGGGLRVQRGHDPALVPAAIR
jgi:hypothetical protein